MQPRYANGAQVERKFWYTGYTYHATPGSRAAITDVVKNGYAMCLDPEANTDRASLAAAMNIMPEGSKAATTINPNAYVWNVTRPVTGILGLFAGIVTGLPPEGRAGEGWVTLVTSAELVQAWVLGDITGATPADYDCLLAPVTAQWYLSPVTVAESSAAAVQAILRGVARPLVKENVSSAALKPVRLTGGFSCNPAI